MNDEILNSLYKEASYLNSKIEPLKLELAVLEHQLAAVERLIKEKCQVIGEITSE